MLDSPNTFGSRLHNQKKYTRYAVEVGFEINVHSQELDPLYKFTNHFLASSFIVKPIY